MCTSAGSLPQWRTAGWSTSGATPITPPPTTAAATECPITSSGSTARSSSSHPLKRKGERGENQWERISWDQALDEIAAKLAELKAKHGAETLALHEGTYRSDMYPMRTRFLNLFGNPSNIGCAGTICRCNTIAMNYALLGCANSRAKLQQMACVVLHGNNIGHTAPLDWQRLKQAGGVHARSS